MKISASVYSLLTVPALLLPIAALTLVYYWKNITHWTQHPIARKLSAFTSPTARGEGGASLLTWVHVLREVNMDCLSLEKLVIAINPVSKVSCKIDIQTTVPCGRVLIKKLCQKQVSKVTLHCVCGQLHIEKTNSAQTTFFHL